MHLLNSEDRAALTAIEFRQRVRRLQLSDLVDTIAQRRSLGVATDVLDQKVERIAAEIETLSALVQTYQDRRASCA